MITHSYKKGFTLIELIVVIGVIGILASIIYANFGNARAAARDDVRKSSLEEVRLALELYKAQNGSYPPAGCTAGLTKWAGPDMPAGNPGWEACDEYISGLVSGGFIASLPRDPRSEAGFDGYVYRSTGDNYKLVNHSAEQKLITSYSQEHARCPTQGGPTCLATPIPNHYAVYSPGAATW